MLNISLEIEDISKLKLQNKSHYETTPGYTVDL